MDSSQNALDNSNQLVGIIQYCGDQVFPNIEINHNEDLQALICEKLLSQQIELETQQEMILKHEDIEQQHNKLKIDFENAQSEIHQLRAQLKNQAEQQSNQQKQVNINQLTTLQYTLNEIKGQVNALKASFQQKDSDIFTQLSQQVQSAIQSYKINQLQDQEVAIQNKQLNEQIQLLQQQIQESKQHNSTIQATQFDTLNQIGKKIAYFNEHLHSDLIKFILQLKEIKIKQVENKVEQLQAVISNEGRIKQKPQTVQNLKTSNKENNQIQQIKNVVTQFEKDFNNITNKKQSIKTKMQDISKQIDNVLKQIKQAPTKKNLSQVKKSPQQSYKNIVYQAQLDFNNEFLKIKAKWNQLYIRLQASSSKTLAIEQKFQLVRQKFQNLKNRNLKQAQSNYQKYQLQNQLYIRDKQYQHELKNEKEKFYREKIEYYEQQRKEKLKYKEKLKQKMAEEQKQKALEQSPVQPTIKAKQNSDLQDLEQEVGNILLNSLKGSGELNQSQQNTSSQILSLQQSQSRQSDQFKQVELYQLLIEIFKDNFLTCNNQKQFKQNQHKVAQFIDQLKGCEKDMTIQELKKYCQEQILP